MGMCPFLKEECIGNNCEMYDEESDSCLIPDAMKKIKKTGKDTKPLMPR